MQECCVQKIGSRGRNVGSGGCSSATGSGRAPDLLGRAPRDVRRPHDLPDCAPGLPKPAPDYASCNPISRFLANFSDFCTFWDAISLPPCAAIQAAMQNPSSRARRENGGCHGAPKRHLKSTKVGKICQKSRNRVARQCAEAGASAMGTAADLPLPSLSIQVGDAARGVALGVSIQVGFRDLGSTGCRLVCLRRVSARKATPRVSRAKKRDSRSKPMRIYSMLLRVMASRKLGFSALARAALRMRDSLLILCARSLTYSSENTPSSAQR